MHTRRIRQPWRWLPFGLRLRWASWRAWSSQHRVLRRSILLAVVLAASVTTLAVRIEAAETLRQWGRVEEVAIASRALVTGEEVGAQDFELVTRPVAMIPVDARRTVPAKDALLRDLVKGDVLTDRDLLSKRPGLGLQDNHQAVNIERDASLPSTSIGDRVELHIFFEEFGTTIDRAAIEGHVVDQQPDAITVAVAQRDVALLAQGLSTGNVVVTLAS